MYDHVAGLKSVPFSLNICFELGCSLFFLSYVGFLAIGAWRDRCFFWICCIILVWYSLGLSYNYSAWCLLADQDKWYSDRP